MGTKSYLFYISAPNRRQQISQENQNQLPLKKSLKIEGSKIPKKSKISCL